ncbi:hypothetical protein PK35_15515 [Tamlana nanhaiensis]|uniref:Uncharacterized protein n=1 Tax=Neotamlana nanhaiensis TaxID=1382798 RepID=A0A0D7W089_9FLAO|nr:hypothetical protein [Tamlana nanhaiensis]KJD31242.1 hypothetical protein PK35_15515 [Tamlana nanhaiensis]
MNFNFFYPNVSLVDFFIEEKIGFIKHRFFANGIDVKNGQFKRVFMVPSNDMIYDIIFDEDGEEKKIPTWQYYPEEKELDFFDDYFFPLLRIVKNKYVDNFNAKLNQDIHAPDSKMYFIESEINLINSYSNALNNISLYANYNTAKDRTKIVLEEIINILKSKMPNSFSDFNADKIMFNLNKKEVCQLFQKLSDLGFVNKDQAQEKELGALLEKHFLYYNEKSKKYMSMDKAYNYFSTLRTDAAYATPSKKLKKITF